MKNLNKKPADDDDENAEIVLPSSSKVKVEEIYRGAEPNAFKMAFPMWRERETYIDQHAIRQDRMIQKYKEKVRATIPFLEVMRKKYHMLLTDDETVNLHNAVQLIDVGHRCGQNVDLLMTTLDEIEELGFKERDVELLEKFAGDLMIFIYKNKEDLGLVSN